MKSIALTLLSTFLSLQLCLFPAFGKTGGEEQEKDLKLYAQFAVLMDAASGWTLYGKEELLQRPMASTIKIMTCIPALENGSSDDVVKVSFYVAGQPKVHLGVSTGETFRLGDLPYSLMLESHNDTVVMIAEHIGGDVKGFARMINQKARDIGCENIYFIIPNGLDAVETDEPGREQIHSTTTADLARVMSYCVWEPLRREEFLNITQTQSYYFIDLEGKRSFNCTNHNAFLSMMNGVSSGKTGFIGGAGYSYIGALEDGGRQFVVALLGCGWPPHKTWKWSDTRALFTYGLANHQYREVYREQNPKPIPVENGISPETGIGQMVYTDVTMNLKDEEKSPKPLMKEGEKAQMSTDIPRKLKAPARVGTVVGSATYYLEEKPVKVFPIYAGSNVEEVTLNWRIRNILDKYLVCSAW